MTETGSDSFLHALLGQKPGYPKEEHPEHFRKHHKNAIIYEDDEVVAIDQTDTDHEGGSAPHLWTERIILVPKKHIESLLDLDVADGPTAIALLRGIQKVALQLGLERQGFEVAIDVMPPEQHSNLLKIKIRSGEKAPISSSGSGL
jgi:hypothetical protein